MKNLAVALVSLFLAVLPGSVAAAGDLLAVDWDGNSYRLDAQTGSGTLLADTGFNNLNCMAVDSGGAVVSVANEVFHSTARVIAIDPQTGLGTELGVIGHNDVRALAFDDSDVLFAIFDMDLDADSIDELWVIDLATFGLRRIGATGLTGLQALSFGPGGLLYGYDVMAPAGRPGSGLVTLDLATGVATDLDPSFSGDPEVQFLVADGLGGLLGGRDVLYAIDPATGERTSSGGGGYSDLRGAGFPVQASWENYGSGLAGTGGIPGLTLSGDPVIGTTVDLQIGNSLGAPTSGFLFVGLAKASLPGSWGSDLLVQPLLLLPLSIPAPGLDLPAALPADSGLCGVSIYAQVLESDPGAVKGTSASAGLDMRLGR